MHLKVAVGIERASDSSPLCVSLFVCHAGSWLPRSVSVCVDIVPHPISVCIIALMLLTDQIIQMLIVPLPTPFRRLCCECLTRIVMNVCSIIIALMLLTDHLRLIELEICIRSLCVSRRLWLRMSDTHCYECLLQHCYECLLQRSKLA